MLKLAIADDEAYRHMLNNCLFERSEKVKRAETLEECSKDRIKERKGERNAGTSH